MSGNAQNSDDSKRIGGERSALKLLERMARASRQPEHFTELCVDWAALPNETIESEEFATAIDNILILERARDSSGGRSMHRTLATSAADFMQISRSGRIESISAELSDILGRKVGDAISAAVLDQFQDAAPASPDKDGPLSLSEIVDRFGVNRLVHFAPVVDQSGEIRKFVAHVSRRRVPEKTRRYMRTRFGVTPAELNILDLVLQRYRTEQIASLRKISINTVRTHINRILKKLDCRSLTESLAYTEEITELVENFDEVEFLSRASDKAARKQARRISLPGGGEVEYMRYGSPGDRALIVLHSLEYGFQPPPEFMSEARERGYCLYFPLRPGFGETTPAKDLAGTAAIIDQFLEALDLREATLVAFSMAAPIALHMKSSSARVHNLLIVNYAMNATEKIRPISPTWVRGLIKLGLTSHRSMNYALSACKALIKMMGPIAFYRRLYAECETDLAYLERHTDDFEDAAAILLGSQIDAARIDIESAFRPMPGLSALLARRKSVMIANGKQQHAVPIAIAKAEASRLGVAFHAVEGGRNWAFQQPAMLFDLLSEQLGAPLAKAAE